MSEDEYFSFYEKNEQGLYKPRITACENRKGVLDVDTVKGCTCGMKKYPDGGCYGECYAYKIARKYAFNFKKSISRKLYKKDLSDVFFAVKNYSASWYRIGTTGDPSHDWDNTLSVCNALKETGKIPVIITKHWYQLSDKHLNGFKAIGVVFNTSTSGMDTDQEIEYRLEQIDRIEDAGMVSVCRVVTCEYGNTEWGISCNKKQEMLLSLFPVIDNPFRATNNNQRVLSGDIIITKREDAVGGGKYVSLHKPDIYLGKCKDCPDQCGVKRVD